MEVKFTRERSACIFVGIVLIGSVSFWRLSKRTTTLSFTSIGVGNMWVAPDTLHFEEPENMTKTELELMEFNVFLTVKRLEMLKQTNLSDAFPGAMKLRRNYSEYVFAQEVRAESFFSLVQQDVQLRVFALIGPRGNTPGDGAADTARVQWMPGALRARQADISWPIRPLYPFTFDAGACANIARRHYGKGGSLCADRTQLPHSVVPISESGTPLEYADYRRFINQETLVFMIVARNVLVTESLGLVITNKTVVASDGCAPDMSITSEGIIADLQHDGLESAPVVEEVFVSAQRVSGAFYHWNVEVLPKILTYWRFLRDNPHVRIQVTSGAYKMAAAQLPLFGISGSRIVTGDVRAKMAYLPQGAGCGVRASPLAQARTKNFYDKHIQEHVTSDGPRDAIVLIQRRQDGKRPLKNFAQVLEVVRAAAAKHKLSMLVLSDYKLPTFRQVIEMFNRAVMVVGPHGAGLTNIMFSRPGTVVIEVQCGNKEAVFCYPYLTRNLGHVYHGLKSTRISQKELHHCPNVQANLKDIEASINFYLETYVPKLVIK